MAKKKDEVPEDINKELESPKFGKPKSLTNTGYVLDINEKDKKVDLQLYESVQGTTILEGLGLIMKLDSATKHFICKRCGLYATREQVSDIRYKLSRKESTKSDKQYDYLDWWQKSKSDKAKE